MGCGSKMMHRMGYTGGGIGKWENGIINPITATSNIGRSALGSVKHNSYINRSLEKLITVTATNDVNGRVCNKVFPWPKDTTLITGSSIISGLEKPDSENMEPKFDHFLVPSSMICTIILSHY